MRSRVPRAAVAAVYAAVLLVLGGTAATHTAPVVAGHAASAPDPAATPIEFGE